MHLLIPFAGVSSPAGQAAQAALKLPNLMRLLAGMREVSRDEGDELSRIPPHERAMARSLGLLAGDRWPQAAWTLQQQDMEPGDMAWGVLTPAHQLVGTEQVTLLPPQTLQLDAASSRACCEAIRPLFESEGATVRWTAPLCWHIAHPDLATLETASLDRVSGRSVDPWLPRTQASRRMRRLLMEAQMTLHALPLNEAREAAGQLTVNACWLSGCGALPPSLTAEAPLREERSLCEPALNEDWPAWTAAWHALDNGLLARLLDQARSGEPTSLTLCGERHAARFDWTGPGWLQRLGLRRGTDVAAVLGDL